MTGVEAVSNAVPLFRKPAVKNARWTLTVIVSVVIFMQIRQHYQKISRQINKSLDLQVEKFECPIVIVPIQGWDCVSEKALRFVMQISNDVTAIYVCKKEEYVFYFS